MAKSIVFSPENTNAQHYNIINIQLFLCKKSKSIPHQWG